MVLEFPCLACDISSRVSPSSNSSDWPAARSSSLLGSDQKILSFLTLALSFRTLPLLPNEIYPPFPKYYPLPNTSPSKTQVSNPPSLSNPTSFLPPNSTSPSALKPPYPPSPKVKSAAPSQPCGHTPFRIPSSPSPKIPMWIPLSLSYSLEVSIT